MVDLFPIGLYKFRNQQMDCFCLTVGQPGNIDGFAAGCAQQIIGGYTEILRNPDQHIEGRTADAGFIFADHGLGKPDFGSKLLLGQPAGPAQLPEPFCENTVIQCLTTCVILYSIVGQ